MSARRWKGPALVLALLPAAGFADAARERPAPPAAVSQPAPPAALSVPRRPSPSPPPLNGAIDCPVKRQWTARLMADRAPFRAQWLECRPRRTLDVPPQQIALWQPGVTALAWGLENTDGENRLLIEKADSVDFDADGLQEILVVMRHEGTGAFTEWCLAGRKGTGIGCWDNPELEAPAARLLGPDEDFGARGWQLRVLPRGLRLERTIYHTGVDPNCCPSRGTVVVELAPRAGKLEISAMTRRPPAGK